MGTDVSGVSVEKPKILVVDDDLHMLGLLKSALQGNDLVPLVASDCKRALRIVSRTPADLAIIDYKLPQDTSGLTLVKLMRRANHRLPIILITGYSTEDLAIVALREGINDYFPKPFLIDDLLVSIRRLLSFRMIDPPPTSTASSSSVLHPIEGQPSVGESQPTREIRGHISKVASTDGRVLTMQDILELILNTADGALAIDREQRIVLWNKAAEMLLGFKADEVIGKFCFELMGDTNEASPRQAAGYPTALAEYTFRADG